MTDIMRTIKTGYCPSLSGRTTLTYHIGWLEGKIYFRLHENSSGGLFSKEWVSLERLCIEEGKPISATAIQSLFNSKSANTGGFVLSVLLSEGLVKPIEAKKRSYLCCDPTTFKETIMVLMAANETTPLEEVAPITPRKKSGRKNP